MSEEETSVKEPMSKKKKTTIIVSSVVAGLLIIAILTCLILWGAPSKGKVTTEHWCHTMEYTDDYAFNIEKDPNKDFVILAIADTQLADLVEPFGEGDPFKEIDQMVAERRPDLIVVMGDITWTAFTKLSVLKFVDYMDNLGIPWAPIMGNHEDEREQGYYCVVDRNWVADQCMKSSSCIFKKGPNNIGGVGNYVINIKENGKIKETMVMMDTHAKRQYPEKDNAWKYDYIYDSQQDWYKWVIDGVTKLNNNEQPESMLYIHIPLNEYVDAYEYWESTGKDPEIGFGNKNEDVYCGYMNSGMFDVLKEVGSTKYVFAGHDHQNNYSVLYEGIRLTYCTKTGFKCDHHEGQTGGTYITIGDEIKIEHSLIKY